MSTTQDYGEPWHLDFETSAVLDRRDCLALVVPAPRRRAIACVNACFGMADPAAEIESMRAAIRETASHLSGFLGFHSDGLSLEQVRALSATLDKLKPFLPDATPPKP